MTLAPNMLRVNVYRVLVEAVETGLRLGWVRAHKHTDDPAPEMLQEKLHDAIMLEISEWFTFPEEP